MTSVVKSVYSTRRLQWKSQKLAKKITIITSFIFVLTGTLVGINYINVAKASWNGLITWTSQADFENNQSSVPGATVATNVDTSTSVGDVMLKKAGDIGKSMAIGSSATYVVKSDGTLWVSGANSYGQLGLGDLLPRNSFTQVTSLGSDVSSVVSTLNSAFVIKNDGTLWATGSNTYGQLGIAAGDIINKYIWVDTGVTNVKQVSSGYDHSVLLKNDGTVWATGFNGHLQLGSGSSNNGPNGRQVWAQLIDNGTNVPKTDALFVAASYYATYVVKKDGTVKVSGSNSSGQLGIGTTNGDYAWTNSIIDNVAKVFAPVNSGFAMALKNDNTLWAIGSSYPGSTGLAPSTTYNTWTQTAITDAVNSQPLAGLGLKPVDIAVGSNHTIMLMDNGLLVCAGICIGAQTGNSVPLNIFSSYISGWFPVNYNANDIVNVEANSYYSFLLKSDGNLISSGSNSNGELGTGDIRSLGNFTDIGLGGIDGGVNNGRVASSSASQYIIKSDGTLWVAGSNYSGQLGLGEVSASGATNYRYEFTKAEKLGDHVVKVVAGSSYAFALKDNGDLYAAGSASYIGQASPYLGSWVKVMTSVSDVSTNNGASILLKTDGTVWVTGYNYSAQLATGGTSNVSGSWVAAKFNSATAVTCATKVSMGSSHALIIANTKPSGSCVPNTGELYATGSYNYVYNQLGIGDSAGKYYFTKSAALNAGDTSGGVWVKNAWAGNAHDSFMQKTNDTIWAVGYNNKGQLGTGNTSTVQNWAQLSTDFNGALDISAGYSGTFILKSNKDLYAAGTTASGELGIGSSGSTYKYNFYQVKSDIAGMALGDSQAIAYDSAGELYATGSNSSGQLGIVGNAATKYWRSLTNINTNGMNVSYNSDKMASGMASNYIIKSDGTLWVAGANLQGQLGLGDNFGRNLFTQTPLTDVIKVVAGPLSALALKSDGTVWATGRNTTGQLGTGDTIPYLNRKSWVKVLGTANDNNDKVIDIGTNGQISDYDGSTYGFSMAVKLDGSVWSTGYNSSGQLGVGNTTATNTWVRAMSTGGVNITNAAQVSVGGNYAMIITTSASGNQLWSVGNNSSGQLGTGASYPYSYNLFTNTGYSSISKVWAAGSDNYSFMQKSDGTLWAVGANNYGQLGIGTSVSTVTWTQLPSFSNALDVKLNNSYGGMYPYGGTFILKSDKTLYVAGMNTAIGELGSDQSNVSKYSPFKVGDDVAGISVSSYGDIIAYKSDGSLYAAGQNTDGQFGIGGAIFSANGSRYGFNSSLSGNVNKQNINYPGVYLPSGTISNLKIDSGDGNTRKWNSISWTTDTPTNTSIKFRVRRASTESDLDNATWSSYITVSGDRLPDFSTATRWLEIEVTLGSSDSLGTPVLHDFSLEYYNDVTPPQDPAQVKVFDNNGNDMTVYGQGGVVDKIATESKFYNSSRPMFKLSGAVDELDGSGVASYLLDFVDDPTAEPMTSYSGFGTTLTHNPSDPQVFTIGHELGYTYDYNNDLWLLMPAGSKDGTYYLRARIVDNAGNMSNATTLFTYKYDSTAPTAPTSVSVLPFGWSSNNNFTFNWAASTDNATGHSGVVGYQYKVNDSDDNWVDSAQLVGTELVLSDSNNNNSQVISGKNTIYIRSVDGAGNTSDVQHIYFYYTGNAPSAPTELTIDKQSSDTNSFTFQWSAPDSQASPYKGDIIGYRYSLGVIPNENNTVFIDTTNLDNLPSSVSYSAGVFTLSNLAAATQQGLNTFYIVAVGSDGSSGELVSYSSDDTATIGFECYTSAPNAPTGIQLFDTSNKDSQAYSVAVKWTEPVDKGVGFAGYNIYRSADGITFSQIGTSTSISFIDFGSQSDPLFQGEPLLSIKYYYKVLSRDNSDNISLAPTSTPSIIPTGKYSAAPLLDNEYGIKKVIGVSTAQFTWKTEASDHTASTVVYISESEVPVSCDVNVEFILTDPSMSVDHTIKATGLKPDTQYNYRVRWFDSDKNCGTSDNLTFTTKPLPRITSMVIQDVRLYTAVLTWSTSEPAAVDLLYGKTTNYSNDLKNISGGQTTIHSIRLDGLEESSIYHFAIRITDVDGSFTLSDDYSFETQKYPRISNVRFQPLADQATAAFQVVWDTNVPTTSVIQFKSDGGTTQESVKTKLETQHSIIINGLFDNTYYLMNAIGVDQFGNSATSDMQRIKTAYDTRPPVISAITTEASNTDFGAAAKSQIVISWQTDEPGTSQVEYDFGVIGETYGSKTQEDATLTNSHVVVLTNLRPSSAYHLRAVSKDASGNKGVSDQQSVITEQARSSVLDMILNSLQSSLGWMFGMKG